MIPLKATRCIKNTAFSMVHASMINYLLRHVVVRYSIPYRIVNPKLDEEWDRCIPEPLKIPRHPISERDIRLLRSSRTI
jgi:hypothetical protein